MIEVNLSEIVSAVEPLKTLSNSKIKGRTAYRVAKFLKRVEEEYQLFETTRMSLVQEYCKKDEDGNPVINDNVYSIDPERIAEFNTEIEKLLNTSVKIEMDPMDDLGDAEFTPNDIMLLEKFIVEE